MCSLSVDQLDKRTSSQDSAVGQITRTGRVRSSGVEWTLGGICGNCRVTTSFGDLPVQVLRKRDPLRTTDGRLAPVQLVNRISLDEGFLADNPDARPVRISANAFGPGRPKEDLLVSPHQTVDCSAVGTGRSYRLARDLDGRPGIFRHSTDTVTYYLFHCGEATSVTVEGVAIPVGH